MLCEITSRKCEIAECEGGACALLIASSAPANCSAADGEFMGALLAMAESWEWMAGPLATGYEKAKANCAADLRQAIARYQLSR